ncbi:hypothetical protein RFI_38314 [Reticulomyxa filosa]|uniref:MBTPS1 fourth domain-containing protein n=1 Tax=Reticulomyxa filosa TaxID=46433 RepID=X6LAW1_RETFI|nr:hypothetical protein RFI_38314 [Reticulomyxa filosa]|eukprot:ETN99167.1 hypothetical protein RFI_38314 [Reticulomyxa filosa]
MLWDQFRNLQYPLGYIPRDDLDIDKDMLDWTGDHLHTNYHGLYDALKDKGYFVEVLGTDYTCVNATHYAALIIVDPEEEFFEEEIEKLEDDILQHGLSLVIVADWYNEKIAERIRFFDDNTRSLWDALTGGANVPALNDLLLPFRIQWSNWAGLGKYQIHPDQPSIFFQSGNAIGTFPANGKLVKREQEGPHNTDLRMSLCKSIQ